MEKSAPIEIRFLDEFIRTIIENQAIKHLVTIEVKSPFLDEKLKNEMQKVQTFLPTQKLRSPFPHQIISKTTQIKTTTTTTNEIKPLENKVQIQKPSKPQQKTISGLPHINPLLADPAVQSLECTAPGKPLLVNKGGLIQATNFSLNQDEINTFMREISERTRIPLTQGLFKAFIGNLVITAVISDIIGTRFVIQKRY